MLGRNSKGESVIETNGAVELTTKTVVGHYRFITFLLGVTTKSYATKLTTV